MTLLEEVKKGSVPDVVRKVIVEEGLPEEMVLEGMVAGRVVIPSNRLHPPERPCGIGARLRVKVNANIGSSPRSAEIEIELRKLSAAEEAGADTVMDLSTGGDLAGIKAAILSRAKVPVGTVPIYQAAVTAGRERGRIVEMTEEEIFAAIEDHARAGVDFVTVHCGVTQRTLQTLKTSPRLMGVVSRGGAFLLEWMIHHGKENPLYSGFDRLLDIARRWELTLSLGDGLRPGCIDDSTDPAQVEELVVLGELVRRCRQAGVQVMVEGPGHIPLDQVEANVRLEKAVCAGAPFYVLGPLVTDIAAGWDHVACAIGGATAAMAGADFLCYVTPSEHLALPGEEEVRQGVVVARIAAHAADLARGDPRAWARDRRMALYRRRRDWEGQIKTCLDPVAARRYLKDVDRGEDYCSMCSEYCSLKILSDRLPLRE